MSRASDNTPSLYATKTDVNLITWVFLLVLLVLLVCKLPVFGIQLGVKYLLTFCHVFLNCQALMPNVTHLNLSHNQIDTIEHLQVHHKTSL